MRRKRFDVSLLYSAVALCLCILLLLPGCNGPFSRAALQVDLTPDPNPPGITPTTFVVTVKDTQGQPVDGATVTVAAVSKDEGQQGPRGTLASSGHREYRMSGIFPSIGNWKVSVTAAKEGYDTGRHAFAILSLHPVP